MKKANVIEETRAEIKGNTEIRMAVEILLVVVDIAHLRGNGDAFLIEGPITGIVVHGVTGAAVDAEMKKKGTNHGAGATFAGFAVDNNEMIRI